MEAPGGAQKARGLAGSVVWPWLPSPSSFLLSFTASQVYSSSEFLAVQPTPTFAERSYSEDREEGWERSSEGENGRRPSTEVR